MNHLHQQLSFIRELDRLKSVYRKALVKSDNNRFENSAEHSWHVCMIACVLREYVDEPINIDRAIRMLLLHDIVEIDAGDTFAFADSSALAQQSEKERMALKRICSLLPDHQRDEMVSLWTDFEEGRSIESRYAQAIDRIVPVFMNTVNDGGAWRRHTITRSQLLKRNDQLRLTTPRLWSFVTAQIDHAVAEGWIQEG